MKPEKINELKQSCKKNPHNSSPELDEFIEKEMGLQKQPTPDSSYQLNNYHISKKFGDNYQTNAFCFKQTDNPRFDSSANSEFNQRKAVFQSVQEDLKQKHGNSGWKANEGGLGFDKEYNTYCTNNPNVTKEVVKQLKSKKHIEVVNKVAPCDLLNGVQPKFTQYGLESEPDYRMIHDIPKEEKEPKMIMVQESSKNPSIESKSEPEPKKISITSKFGLKGIIANQSTEIFIPTEDFDYDMNQKIQNIIRNDEHQTKKKQKVTYITEVWNPTGGKYGTGGKEDQVNVLLTRCNKNGKNGLCAPIGLQDNIEQMFTESGIQFDIEDHRQLPTPHPFPIKPTLRGYQKNLVEQATKKGHGIVQVATGGGKTVIATKLIADIGQDTLFFVPNNSLFYNAKKQISEYVDTKDVNIGQIGGLNVDYKNDPNKTDINIVSLPLAAMATDPKGKDRIDPKKREVVLEAMKNANMVIFDETHHLPAKTYKAVSENTPAKYRYGLSATPYRKDNDELQIVAGVGSIIGKGISAKELIDKGDLTPPEIYIINNADIDPKTDSQILANLEDESCKINEKTKMHKNVKEDHRLPDRHTAEKIQLHRYIEKGSVECNKKRNTRILDLVTKLDQYDKTKVVFVNSVEHGKKLQDQLESQGIYSEILTGDTENEILKEPETEKELEDMEEKEKEFNKKRTILFDKMSKGNLKTIIATDKIMGEGVDIPNIDALVLADMRSNRVSAVQIVGRALRKKDGKKKALIFDFKDPVEYLDNWSNSRLEVWSEEQYPILHKEYGEIDNVLETSLGGKPTLTLSDLKKNGEKIIKVKKRLTELNDMNLPELKEKAKTKNIKLTGLKKQDIIDKMMEIN